MSEREQLQYEVLAELASYSERLIPAVQHVIDELNGNEKSDTGEFLNEVITGINWEIEVYNQCADLVNSQSSYINKRSMIQSVTNLGQALNSGDSLSVAECLELDFLPFLNKLALAAKKITAQAH